MSQVRRLNDIALERWKNGGGVTRTLARQGDDWRVSIANIERDGAYSSFPGMLRLSRLLRGAGVRLHHGDTCVMLEPGMTTSYDGAPAWQAYLKNGPCESLNVMARADSYQLSLESITHEAVIPSLASALILINDARLRITDTQPLTPGDYIVLPASGIKRHVQVESYAQRPPLLILIEPRADHQDSV